MKRKHEYKFNSLLDHRASVKVYKNKVYHVMDKFVYVQRFDSYYCHHRAISDLGVIVLILAVGLNLRSMYICSHFFLSSYIQSNKYCNNISLVNYDETVHMRCLQ